ncbi:hypothetical protein GHK92_08540 [Nocardioides sp. dk4132]|uniref:hypothetical protein n=1 Tax=unclassified Nocardioides TaxID=2615069 RepID=UPI0012955CC1|nr:MULTISPECIES: hypothetical protein [unclassified Nocardioides]MQW75919.1 hypothetical protein [Nocardioides sp. dk4132]QGA08780.1 hypothetical protein GFH29_16300 [Nocardioides sp. dk884]
MTEQVVERFKPTSGRIMGTIGLVLVAVALVLGLLDPDSGFGGPVFAAAVAIGVLTWASMLRPAMWVTTESLVMRNMFETVTIPLAAVEQVAVQQVTAVRAGDRRYVSPAVGRSLRQAMKGRRAEQDSASAVPSSYPDMVEQRIRHLADDAAAARGIRPRSAEQVELGREVRRQPAWAEIVLLVAAVVGFVITLAV